ncbi:PREDICTED: nuclear pore complex protein Nup205-like [Amphimedon queenslandica]|uniref:Uncharacterized protein n=1 Tax=Amphimedon queenslandica TaxID=400682 RepID=A0AAN0IZ42_AMPQE|nr:PREDICTED: nuclear pore complex protein Nup205-like [Amphimedon queenslandica]|eukprot:XP_019850045.1 PREDICTED: nuclear pore complex protein Nup205-like [Amphimedon queenslandica]
MSDEYFNVREKLGQLESKLEGLKNMTSEEMKQLYSDVTTDDTAQLSPLQLHQQLKSVLNRLVSNKQQQLKHFIYTVEHLLSVLWSHLQFYLVHCQPTEEYHQQSISQFSSKPIRNLQGLLIT